jgi:ABC-type phosphate/phosphonate transport system substrate-binding protein
MRYLVGTFCLLWLATYSHFVSAETPASLTMVVMDPLAKELSCPCVQGYAQRDYNQFAEWLSKQLGRRVEIVFSESLVTALKDDPNARADIVIGKQSVVRYDAAKLGRAYQRTALLSGKDGATTQTGLIVVATGDPAKTVADLKDYRLIFGPADCDEKSSAAVALLKAHGVAVSATMETAAGCEEGAVKILELPAGERGAAVISSYAHPLLEGCGTVPKGAIRVVGETAPVPFVAAFVAADLPDDLRKQITASFILSAHEPLLCFAIESKRGFVAVADDAATETATPTTAAIKKK